MNQAVILLGSNLFNRKSFLDESKIMMKNFGSIVSSSSVYESVAWGFESENNFLNQVLILETELNPIMLLSELQKVENKLGRKRIAGKYISRTIDLDILFFNEEIIEEEYLIVPHSHIQDRLFTLLPLVEILEDFIHPTLKKTIKELVDLCPDRGKVWKI